MVTNLALIVFMWTRHRDEFSYLLHGIFPVLSILVFIGPLVTSLYPFPASPLNIFPFVTVAWILVGIGWMLWLRANDRPKLDLIGQIIFVPGEGRDVETSSVAVEEPMA